MTNDINSIKKWYDDFKNNIININILMLTFKKSSDIKEFIKNIETNKSTKVISLNNVKEEDLKADRNFNLIITTTINISLNNLIKIKDFKNYILYKKISNFDKKDLLNMHSSSILFTDNYSWFDMINKPYSVNIFISKFLNYDNGSEIEFDKNDVKRLLFRNKSFIDIHVIQNDLKYLQEQNKLTSRLAIFIYKISTYNFNASDKLVGLVYQDKYEKSKVFNNKHYNISNTKGYDVIDNNKELLQIAKYLCMNTNSRIETIAEATQLNINTVRGFRE
ncbi:MAG: hypothetical protein CL623_08165 [Arcobacter sp.]|nr:hypothetical protein [Arcobacter sp.]|tara:strand:+ start:22529 stop:23359 length:831 start_codon:yes stop_codon:yes gene_type:complete